MGSKVEETVYQLHAKHEWSVSNHMLSGITFGSWIKLLYRNRKDIQWIRYFHRILFLTIMSTFNSLCALPDTIFYGRQIQKQEINKRPVFILGHPRTGTTHLHNLLSLDKQFIFCNTFQVGFPSSFLTGESLGKILLSPLISKTRPMDNMTLTFDIPQEDELASSAMSGGLSPYMALVFPQKFRYFLDRLTFETPDSSKDFNSWLSAFRYLLKKVCKKIRSEFLIKHHSYFSTRFA